MTTRRTSAAGRGGFSLLEMLVVVAILAIISAIGVYNMEGAQGRAKTARAQSDMRTLAVGIESYAVDHNEYPPNLPLAPPGSGPADAPRHLPVTPPQITTPIAYLTSLPADPFRVGKNVYGLASVAPLRVELLFYNYFRITSPGDWMRDYIGGRYSSLIAVNIPPEEAGLPGNIGAEIKYGQWLLWSCGPDLRNWDAAADFLIPGDLGSPLKPPVTPPFGYTFDVPYDPTNGSTSFGNITGSQAGINWKASVPTGPGTPDDPNGPTQPPDGPDNPGDTGGATNDNPPAKSDGSNQDGGKKPSPPKPAPGNAGDVGGGAADSSGAVSTGGGGKGRGGGSHADETNTRPTPKPGKFTPDETPTPEPTADERIIALGELMHSRVAATKQRAPRPPTPPTRFDGRFMSLGLLIFALLLLIAYTIFRLLRKGAQVVDPDDINDESIATFNNLATVTELHLANNNITDEGLEHLSQARALESLNLWGSHITDKGLEAIAGLPNLRELVLCDTMVTDAGVRLIAKLPALRELVLMGTMVGDGSVPVLSKMSNLLLLNLRGTNVSPAGLLKLRKALPFCDIKYAALSEEVAADE